MRLCNSRILEEHLVCYQTSQRNWVIIKMLYKCLPWCLLSWHRSRLGFVRESWIRGCSDSRTIPSAGLQDYEDTRLKTSSRVRKVLSLAWKASQACGYSRSPTNVTDSV